MSEFSRAFVEAGRMLVGLDPDLLEIVALSLRVSLTAVALATLVGLPLGAIVATARFPGRGAVIAVLNALMGLPPVVVGLIVYLMLSRAGPLGEFGLLFTPSAMVIAQAVLVAPIITALTRQTVSDLADEYGDTPAALGVTRPGLVSLLLWEGRYRLITAIVAGFGRAVAEVGAVIIVGGNINHHTRVMTTAIALETSKGNLGLALGLGAVLLLLTLAINVLALSVANLARRSYGA